jgi:hypothetical protein
LGFRLGADSFEYLMGDVVVLLWTEPTEMKLGREIKTDDLEVGQENYNVGTLRPQERTKTHRLNKIGLTIPQ